MRAARIDEDYPIGDVRLWTWHDLALLVAGYTRLN